MSDGMTLEEIKEATSYMLASMADCSCPNSLTSPGAQMLDRVRYGVVEGVERGSITLDDFNDNGQLHEIADSAPSVYTHEMWAEFLDLGAYNEEPDIEGEWPNNLNKAAAIALYQIADRLAHTLCEAWREGWVCPACTNPRADYDCSEGDCRAWQCPECDGYDNTHGCQLYECKAPESAGEPLPIRTPGEAMASISGPVSDVLTGPVDLPPASDPILSLIEQAEADSMGFRASWHARVTDAAVSRFRRRVWTATAFLAVVGVALVVMFS